MMRWVDHKITMTKWAAAISAMFLCYVCIAEERTLDPAEQRRHAEQTAFFEREAKRSSNLYMGFAKLFLNRDLERANQDIQTAYAAMLQESAKEAKVADAKELTPQIAGAERLKWQMRTWIRLYYLFGDKSTSYPGRLSPENQARIKEMFWCFLSAPHNQFDIVDKKTGAHLRRSDPRYASAIHGSENHEIMRLGNILLAAQALKDLPEYKDRKLPNGESLRERYERWNTFYKHRWDEMAKHALLVEAFADYGKYTLPEIVNMSDFCEDPELQKKSEMIMDLIWTEWAVGQLNGVRGGGRVRLYQGDENERGKGDTWRLMSLFFFDMGPWWTQWHPDPTIGCPRVMASTKYRIPEIIRDIAKDAVGKGEYAYVGKRLGKQKAINAAEVPVDWSPWYNFDPIDTRMLAYDYCTPDYVMGCLMVDPTLPQVKSHLYSEGKDLEVGYPALTAQNTYRAIIFPTGLNARVVPQCLPSSNTYLKTYLQQQAVQYKNTMIVQRHQKSANTGIMRIFFSKGMKERLIEKDGWFILQEGNAFLAVKGFSRKDGKTSCGTTWNDDCWLHLNDGDAPVVFILGRKMKYENIEAFTKYVLQGKSSITGQGFTFSSTDVDDKPVKLSLFLDAKQIPMVNGKPIDFLPENVFDCPFFKSKHGSGIITIQKGDEKMILDFNKTLSTYETNKMK